jgi:ribosomal-protein-alanine N-acetyltransferase
MSGIPGFAAPTRAQRIGRLPWDNRIDALAAATVRPTPTPTALALREETAMPDDLVTIRRVTEADAGALIRGNRASRAFHAPWVEPFTDESGFARWFAETRSGRRVALVAETGGAIAGMVTLNEVVLGIFCSATVGYYAMAGMAGRGTMTRAVELAVAHGFDEVGLHRVEINIQPENHRSRALVKRLGFRLEGFSPRYLFIDGAWRDHERWAKTADEEETHGP